MIDLSSAQAVADAGRLLEIARTSAPSSIPRRLIALEERAATYASGSDAVRRSYFRAVDSDVPPPQRDPDPAASALFAAAVDYHVAGVLVNAAATREGHGDLLPSSVAQLSSAIAAISTEETHFFSSQETLGLSSLAEAAAEFDLRTRGTIDWLVSQTKTAIAAPLSGVTAASASSFLGQISQTSGSAAGGPLGHAVSIALGALQTGLAFLSRDELKQLRERLSRLWDFVDLEAPIRWLYDVDGTHHTLDSLDRTRLSLGGLNNSAGQLAELRAGFSKIVRAANLFMEGAGILGAATAALHLVAMPSTEILSVGSYTVAITAVTGAGCDFVREGRLAPSGLGVRRIIAGTQLREKEMASGSPA